MAHFNCDSSGGWSERTQPAVFNIKKPRYGLAAYACRRASRRRPAQASSTPSQQPQIEIELNHRKWTQATERGDVVQMGWLLAQGADPNWRRTNIFQYPLLLIAIIHGGPEAVDLLLRHGANPDSRDLRGTPVLVSAASVRHAPTRSPAELIESIRLLLDVGHGDPNLRDTARIGDGRSAPAYGVAAVGSVPVVELLISSRWRERQPAEPRE